MRLIRATGAVADALRRYDRNLDIRYSWEHRKWAITYRTRRPDLLPKPVMFVESEAGPQMQTLAEKSEGHISYRTQTYPAAYVDRLGWPVFRKIVESDSMRASVRRRLKILEEQREAEYRAKAKDRWKEARTYMNWHARTHIMAD